MQRSSSIRFKPLLGVGSDEPLCYLLEIDSYRILLDCGWDDAFDTRQLEAVAREIEKGVDAVLISYPDLAHLGGLAYCVGKLGLEANVYATTPVWKMGQMFMYDAHQARARAGDFDTFDLDDVDAAFDDSRTDRIMLKYSQRMHIGAGIEVTPLIAGHMIGGTVWKVQKEIEEILYAVDFNHKKERHLNRSLLELQFRPSLLITDAYSAADTNTVPRNQRDVNLVKVLQETVARQGDVLMPADTAGRVLEMALFLEQAAATLNESVPSGGSPVSVAVCSEMAFRSIEQAKSQLEWMGDWVMSCFDKNRENPFVFNHVQCCQSLEDIASLPSPRIVLASMPSMEYGFSRELFARWADKPHNLVLFTERSRRGTLAAELMANPTLHARTLRMRRRVPLEGAELEAHLRQKEEAAAAAAAEQETDVKMEEAPAEETADAAELEAIIPSLPNPYFLSSCDLIVGRDDTSKDGAYPMFPLAAAARPQWDDYGVPLEEDEFKLPDEGLQDRMDTRTTEEEEEEEEHDDEADLQEVETKWVTRDMELATRDEAMRRKYANKHKQLGNNLFKEQELNKCLEQFSRAIYLLTELDEAEEEEEEDAGAKEEEEEKAEEKAEEEEEEATATAKKIAAKKKGTRRASGRKAAVATAAKKKGRKETAAEEESVAAEEESGEKAQPSRTRREKSGSPRARRSPARRSPRRSGAAVAPARQTRSSRQRRNSSPAPDQSPSPGPRQSRRQRSPAKGTKRKSARRSARRSPSPAAPVRKSRRQAKATAEEEPPSSRRSRSSRTQSKDSARETENNTETEKESEKEIGKGRASASSRRRSGAGRKGRKGGKGAEGVAALATAARAAMAATIGAEGALKTRDDPVAFLSSALSRALEERSGAAPARRRRSSGADGGHLLTADNAVQRQILRLPDTRELLQALNFAEEESGWRLPSSLPDRELSAARQLLDGLE
mmetsp:Transcript_5527/g.21224  ORF Transcript_5527/g.21224 Transcript_5527/m.21224 type:complete len:954 (+) Transcript_5527:50-2911(+)